MSELADDPEITSPDVRTLPTADADARASAWSRRRAARCIHHYETDERGLITKANLIVATQNNAARIAMSVEKAAKGLIHGGEVSEGLLNMVEMAFRAYDPCFGCATHSLPGEMPLWVRSAGRDGETLRAAPRLRWQPPPQLMAARILGLGNEILADDAFGIRVAGLVGTILPPGTVEVVSSSLSGFHLLDYLLDTDRLVVVDTVLTGKAAPGTLYVVREGEMASPGAGAPHGVALFDALNLARRLGLAAASEVLIVAVEAADCLT